MVGRSWVVVTNPARRPCLVRLVAATERRHSSMLRPASDGPKKEACARTIDGHHAEVARARIRNPAVFYPIARPDDSFGLSRSGSVAR
jgi:hypothetical protein